MPSVKLLSEKVRRFQESNRLAVLSDPLMAPKRGKRRSLVGLYWRGTCHRPGQTFIIARSPVQAAILQPPDTIVQ